MARLRKTVIQQEGSSGKMIARFQEPTALIGFEFNSLIKNNSQKQKKLPASTSSQNPSITKNQQKFHPLENGLKNSLLLGARQDGMVKILILINKIFI